MEFGLKMSQFIIKRNIYKNTKKSIEDQKVELRARIAKVDELNIISSKKTKGEEEEKQMAPVKKNILPIHILRQKIRQK